MELTLSGKTKIKDIKKQFAAYFPFLKLEFFEHRHGLGESSMLVHKFPDSTILSDITAGVKDGVFSFAPSITVAEFEQRLQQEYGLPVQVFRKAGSIWLETVQTDNLPLARQDVMGEESSRSIAFNINTLFL